MKMYTLGPRLHAARHPRRRPALPRRLAAGLAALPRKAAGSGVRAAGRHLRGRRPVRPRRRHHPGAGILPRIRAAIDEALRCKATGEAKTILFCLTGHGHFDMASYDRCFSGQLEDYEYPAEAIVRILKHLPKVG